MSARQRQQIAYGLLGLPLAFAALPIAIHLPTLYSEQVGLSLTLIGALLLLVRGVDAITDPLLGWLADRYPQRRRWMVAALPLLAAALVALLTPPAEAGAGWLLLQLLLVTFALSITTINYYAWGAEVGCSDTDRTAFVAAREGSALFGVMLAAALPSLLADQQALALERLSWLFLPLLLLCAVITLRYAPAPPPVIPNPAPESPWRGLRSALGHHQFRQLLLLFAINGTAAAIPATTLLFYVEHILQRPEQSGLLLLLYFAAAALSLPLWSRLAARYGKPHSWLMAMALAISSFGWAALLGAGDLLPFAAICLLAGIAVGADLMLPPALLADLIATETDPPTGRWFGWWNLVTKANLALAAGIALPLLGLFGFTPERSDNSTTALLALSATYALLPLLLKLLAMWLLWHLPPLTTPPTPQPLPEPS